ncbi:MAG: hypothetical protein HY518_01685 [Candidatus Aenigmarchaeota archaeon]|nr:hypothetical protein [Candidatus Aenigmarchaeota archaeon]
MKQFLFVLAGLSVLIGSASAASGVESFTIVSQVELDLTSHVLMTVRLGDPVSSFSYNVGFDMYNITTESDFKSVCRTISKPLENELSCDLSGVTEENSILKIEFDAAGNIRSTNDTLLYTLTLGSPLPVNDSFIIIRLPEGGTMATETPNQSYSPQDGALTSDGRHIGVFWQRDNLKGGDNLQFSINYRIPPKSEATRDDTITIIQAVVAAAAILGIILYFRHKRFSRHAEIVKTVLNEDEKNVIDILAAHQGTVMQRVVVRETDYSKAKVTRIVKNLKDRGIVDLERIGRTNKITLKIKHEKKEAPGEKAS